MASLLEPDKSKSRNMIKVDLKRFFRQRIWFGWWYRGYCNDDERFQMGGWVRDPNPKYSIIIRKRIYD